MIEGGEIPLIAGIIMVGAQGMELRHVARVAPQSVTRRFHRRAWRCLRGYIAHDACVVTSHMSINRARTLSAASCSSASCGGHSAVS